VNDLKIKIVLGPSQARQPAYLKLEIEKIKIHSADPRWQEVSDVSKVYVINLDRTEAVSFKKLDITGCSLSCFHPAANLEVPYTLYLVPYTLCLLPYAL
jgi:hypothetical protein